MVGSSFRYGGGGDTFACAYFVNKRCFPPADGREILFSKGRGLAQIGGVGDP